MIVQVNVAYLWYAVLGVSVIISLLMLVIYHYRDSAKEYRRLYMNNEDRLQGLRLNGLKLERD